jgi:poly(A) polymerase
VTRIAAQTWMEEPATRKLLAALHQAGIAARFVGGCVRDALLGRPIADIDLATPARPEEIVAALALSGIKTVPTGIEHGTITAVVDWAADGGAKPLRTPRHFEITTLRRDVETYGRRARVAFDADWAQDAARRDFTINAIYLDPDGTVHDPVGGLDDLKARRVRFVGEPGQRIAEDVLRVLRYYRFEARFGGGTGDGDAAARAACREAVPLLPRLSPERVAQEVIRLLAVADPLRTLRMMHEDSVLAAILPEATRLDRLERLIAIEPEPDPLRRLAALVAVDAAGATAIAERLRLSNAWRDRLADLAPPWPLDPPGGLHEQRRALYRLGALCYRDLVLLAAAEGRFDRDRLAELLALAADWTPPPYPIAGRDVTALGIPPGPRVGRLLAQVRQWWEERDFAPDRAACLARLRQLAAADASPEISAARRRPAESSRHRD